MLPNPKYKVIMKDDNHLRGVIIDDTDEKSELPVHIILGACDFSKIKTDTGLKVGKPGQPIAEYTQFGWTTCL